MGSRTSGKTPWRSRIAGSGPVVTKSVVEVSSTTVTKKTCGFIRLSSASLLFWTKALLVVPTFLSFVFFKT